MTTEQKLERLISRVTELEQKLAQVKSTVWQAGLTPSGIKGDVRRVQEIVAAYYGVTVGALLARRRFREITTPRHVAMFLCLEETRCTLIEIGRAFDRDHGAVIHAREAIKNHCATQRDFAETVGRLREMVREDLEQRRKQAA